MRIRSLLTFALGVAGSVVLFAAASAPVGAMTFSNALAVASAPKVENVIWCNRWRCGVGPGILRPRAVGGVWHPWGYGIRPYRWCYYHPYQC
jgi:hypothetical protein